MQLTVNDEKREIADGTHLDVLLDELGMAGRRGLAVAVNAVVVPSAKWPQHLLHDGDVILLIQATQGG